MGGTSSGPGARALQSNIRPTVYGSENEAREQEHTSKNATRTVQAHFGREAWPQVNLIVPRYHGRATRPMMPGKKSLSGCDLKQSNHHATYYW